MTLLRGVCQMPAYVAQEQGFFQAEGLSVAIDIAPTAWVVPQRLLAGEVQFAVIPWTRVAASRARGEDLVLICGSGCEEAAVVVRNEFAIEEVEVVAVPQEGGIKDLTANALMRKLGWSGARTLRLPSGDGAILALVGQGAQAASMVEPYATMLQETQVGRVVARTGEVWPGAPGCSLTTTGELLRERPEVVQRMVAAYLRGAEFIEQQPTRAAEIASGYIGVKAEFIQAALGHNCPNCKALENQTAIDSILRLMLELGYIQQLPSDLVETGFLAEAVGSQGEQWS